MNKNSPFFIVGSPRSGTTLLVQILNSHSRLFIPPETAYFHALATIERRRGISENGLEIDEFVRNYASWKSVPFLDIETGLFTEILLRDATNFRDIFLNLMKQLAKDTGKPRWGEKTPHHLPHTKRILRMFPEAKFICLLRDGRAVVKSRIKHPYWKDNIVSAACKWKNDMAVVKDLGNRYGKSCFMLIRYEQMLKEPEIILRRILGFIDEEFEGGMLDATVSGNNKYDDYYRQSWMKNSTKKIDINRADAWLAAYSVNELKVVESIIGDELREFGYELKSSGGSKSWRLLKYAKSLEYYSSRAYKKLVREYRKIV